MSLTSQVSLSDLKWQLRNVARRCRKAVCSKTYQDRNRDPARSIIVAGTARSGTTWLGELIASQMRCRMMFEPFHTELVSDFAQFNYFQYMRPGQENAALLDYVRRVMLGEIRHPWIDRYVDTFLPRWRVIKEIRACLFLRWIHDYFPEVPMVFIIRHPCAVVASRLRLNWATDGDIKHFLTQKPLLDDFLAESMDIIQGAITREEKHAIVWSVSNLVPLQQMSDTPMHVVFYENLLLHPGEEIPKLFRAIRQPYDESAFRYAHRASMTTKRKSAILEDTNPTTSWRRELSDTQITRVLRVVEGFGLGYLYGDSDLPAEKIPNQG